MESIIISAVVILGGLALLVIGIVDGGRNSYFAIVGAILLAGQLIASAIRAGQGSAEQPRKGD